MSKRFSVEAVFKAVDKITAPVSRMQNRVQRMTRSMGRGFKKLNRTVGKVYIALVKDSLESKTGIIDSPIARSLQDRKKMAIASESEGKEAITEYKVLQEYDLDGKIYSLLNVKIKTGRTHQIRVHMTAIGHPVVGDTVYGDRACNKSFKIKFGLKRQFLHAAELKFVSPVTKKKVSVKTKLPNDLNSILEEI